MAPLIGLLDCLPHQVRAEAAERHGLKDPRAVTLVCVHVRCKGDVLPIGPAQAAYRAAPGGAGADVYWRRRAGAAGAAGAAGVAGAVGAAVVEDAAAGAAADAPDEGCNQRSSEAIREEQQPTQPPPPPPPQQHPPCRRTKVPLDRLVCLLSGETRASFGPLLRTGTSSGTMPIRTRGSPAACLMTTDCPLHQVCRVVQGPFGHVALRRARCRSRALHRRL